ncbi:type IV pilus assembly protein PilM [Demequina iriomotensis]|uniref:type IV pilus assembly protein PilM n=1 Tax=Demequina iriomotensis TaxID=1536641 RepID=UPI000782E86A|nr:type IV pilus assembly protein PilM [Demequina iriomotensis]
MAKSRLIGLDIGTSMVRAAELERNGRSGRMTLVKYAERALPPGAVVDAAVVAESTVTDAIKEMWKEAKFSSKDVVMGVGSSRTAVREVELPLLPMDELRQSLPYQVQDMLPMPVDEALLDFVPGTTVAGEVGTQVRGLLVAATKAGVNANVDAAEKAGLRPTVVDLNALVLLRAARGVDPSTKIVGCVDIGGGMTTVTVTERGVPRVVRVIPTGGQDVTNAIAKRLKIPVSEAEALKRRPASEHAAVPGGEMVKEAIDEVISTLVDAVRNTFVYYQSSNPGTAIEMVVLTGGGALLTGFAQTLANRSRLSVTFGNPLDGITVDPKAEGRITAPVAMAVVVGLAQEVAA